jgi:hypothetical protein
MINCAVSDRFLILRENVLSHYGVHYQCSRNVIIWPLLEPASVLCFSLLLLNKRIRQSKALL